MDVFEFSNEFIWKFIQSNNQWIHQFIQTNYLSHSLKNCQICTPIVHFGTENYDEKESVNKYNFDNQCLDIIFLVTSELYVLVLSNYFWYSITVENIFYYYYYYLKIESFRAMHGVAHYWTKNQQFIGLICSKFLLILLFQSSFKNIFTLSNI